MKTFIPHRSSSQGSAATDLRGSDGCNSSFLHSSFMNSAVEELSTISPQLPKLS